MHTTSGGRGRMAIHIRRREFIFTLGGGAVAWPLGARAQQAAMPVIGWLRGRTSATDALLLPAFRRGLSPHGYVDGQNIAVEYRFAEGHFERLPTLAADLGRRSVALIVAVGIGGQGARAIHAAILTVPMVFN